MFDLFIVLMSVVWVVFLGCGLLICVWMCVFGMTLMWVLFNWVFGVRFIGYCLVYCYFVFCSELLLWVGYCGLVVWFLLYQVLLCL